MAFAIHRRPNLFRQFTLLTAAAALLAAVPVAESAVTFSIRSVELQTGTGYGTDGDEKTGNLLGVTFVVEKMAPNFSFSLDQGKQYAFDIARLSLFEPNSDGGIQNEVKKGVRYDETDDLGVSWRFTVAGDIAGTPFERVVEVVADALGVVGAVSDSAVDYTLDWSPVNVDLGSGQLFSISLNHIGISGVGAPVVQTVTFRLPGPPTPSTRQAPPPSASVPEPGTIALFALGLAGIGAARRKKPAG
jgi:hypothetical protein